MTYTVIQFLFSSITRTILILSSTVLAVFFVYTHFNGAPVNIDSFKLSAEHTPLTELFFTDYLALPATIQAGQTVPIDFTIRNLEGKDMQYLYSVYLITTGGRRIEVAQESVEVANQTAAAIHTSYTFRANSLPVTFYVELPTTGKIITAIVPRPTQ